MDASDDPSTEGVREDLPVRPVDDGSNAHAGKVLQRHDQEHPPVLMVEPQSALLKTGPERGPEVVRLKARQAGAAPDATQTAIRIAVSASP